MRCIFDYSGQLGDGPVCANRKIEGSSGNKAAQLSKCMARALRDLRASCCGKLMTKSKHVRCPCVAPAVSLIPIGMVVVPVISYVGFAQNKHRLDHSATGCSMKHAFHIRIELRTVPPRGTPLKKGYHI